MTWIYEACRLNLCVSPSSHIAGHQSASTLKTEIPKCVESGCLTIILAVQRLIRSIAAACPSKKRYVPLSAPSATSNGVSKHNGGREVQVSSLRWVTVSSA